MTKSLGDGETIKWHKETFGGDASALYHDCGSGSIRWNYNCNNSLDDLHGFNLYMCIFPQQNWIRKKKKKSHEQIRSFGHRILLNYSHFFSREPPGGSAG